MHLKITLSVDDINPSPQYRILGTPVEKWMQKLHDDFGVKFTLFCPSNYHGQWPISEHKGWINELNNDPKFEIACHGHYHQTANPKLYGECEFAELNTMDTSLDRLRMMFNEWNEVGVLPVGWRSPGWLTSQSTAALIPTQFDYAAIHEVHSREVRWGRSNFITFTGHDGIQQENISIHNDNMIMFQSHIAGRHNHNVWNESNYNQLRMSIDHLVQNYTIEFKTLKECV